MLTLLLFFAFVLSPSLAVIIALAVLVAVFALLRYFRLDRRPTATIHTYRYCGGMQETARRARQIADGRLRKENGLWPS